MTSVPVLQDRGLRATTPGFDPSGMTGHGNLVWAVARVAESGAVAVLLGRQGSVCRAEVAPAHALGLTLAPWAAFHEVGENRHSAIDRAR